MTTYKSICEYYRNASVIKPGEIEQLNAIKDPGAFKAAFLNQYKVWKYRKRVKDNRANLAAVQGVEEINSQVRRIVLDNPQIFKAELDGKPESEQKRIIAINAKYLRGLGLDEYYKSVIR
jgi:hypothetical protein